MRKLIPAHEPEVIAAAARKFWRGNTDKVATTMIKSLSVAGIELSSRYCKAHEFEDMAAMVEALPVHLARFVRGMLCDSKMTCCYTVTVCNGCDPDIAEAIGRTLEQASKGHNGIDVRTADGESLCNLGPEWFEP